MIKKSVHEDDLIAGMQRNLAAHDKAQGINNLVKAVDYLQAAMEIFDNAGMTVKSDAVLKILSKIANEKLHKVRKMPSMQQLMDAGVTKKDLLEFNEGIPVAKARINQALRKLGLSDADIAAHIGAHNVMSEQDIQEFTNPEGGLSKMWEWMKNPAEVSPNSDLKEGDEFSISRLSSDEQDAKKHKINVDHHTKGLTSEKMVENLKHHGIVFNLTDDGSADDLLNADIDDEALEVAENSSFEKDFEDES